MSLDIGEYLHIQVLEFFFAILIFRYFFLFLNFFLGHTPFLRGFLAPSYNWTPFFMANMLLHTVRMPNQQLSQQIILEGDYPLKKCDAVRHSIWCMASHTAHSVTVFFKLHKKTKITVSSLLYFKAKNLSFHMPQTVCQYLYNFLCNHRNRDDGLWHFWTYNEIW